MAYSVVFFDLDGTLTDPGEGITASVAYALEHFGISVANRRALYPFIGPPLVDAFMQFYAFSHEDALEAVKQYRVYFSQTGIFQNRVYDGIPALLDELKAEGKTLVLATSKPEAFAIRILSHFDLAQYFDLVVGASFDGRLSKKEDVIAEALARSGVDVQETVMVGDRHHDTAGARVNGMDSIGVTYGYGSREEHEAAGARYIAESIEALGRILRNKEEDIHV